MAKSHRKRSIAVQREKNESLLSNDLRPKNGACPFTFSMKRQCASRKRSISVHYSALSYVIFVCQQRTFSFANKEQIPLLPRTVFLCQQGMFSFANKESFPLLTRKVFLMQFLKPRKTQVLVSLIPQEQNACTTEQIDST